MTHALDSGCGLRPDANVEQHIRCRTPADLFKTAMQIVAALCLAAYFALLAHKAFVDITALAIQYPGESFWPALGGHLLRNLGGG